MESVATIIAERNCELSGPDRVTLTLQVCFGNPPILKTLSVLLLRGHHGDVFWQALTLCVFDRVCRNVQYRCVPILLAYDVILCTTQYHCDICAKGTTILVGRFSAQKQREIEGGSCEGCTVIADVILCD